MIRKKFSYKSYIGTESFAFFGCTKDDEGIASNIADKLVKKGFRLCFDTRGNKKESSFVELSNSINACNGAIIFLSKKSIETLAFRNIVNTLVSINKPLIVFKIGEFELSHGLDMQLANSKIVLYTNANDAVESILETGVLTQNMIGEGMEQISANSKRIVIMISMVAIVAVIFALSAIGIINQRTSAEYILKDVNNLEYLNISKYGDAAIDVLKGKNFEELDLSFGTFDSLEGLKEINIKTINVSDITNDLSLSSLKNIKGLKTVKISQNQLKYADELSDWGLRVVITH